MRCSGPGMVPCRKTSWCGALTVSLSQRQCKMPRPTGRGFFLRWFPAEPARAILPVRLQQDRIGVFLNSVPLVHVVRDGALVLPRSPGGTPHVHEIPSVPCCWPLPHGFTFTSEPPWLPAPFWRGSHGAGHCLRIAAMVERCPCGNPSLDVRRTVALARPVRPIRAVRAVCSHGAVHPCRHAASRIAARHRWAHAGLHGGRSGARLP